MPHLHSREPKDMASRQVNKHNTHALQLPQEVNERILRRPNVLSEEAIAGAAHKDGATEQTRV